MVYHVLKRWISYYGGFEAPLRLEIKGRKYFDLDYFCILVLDIKHSIWCYCDGHQMALNFRYRYYQWVRLGGTKLWSGFGIGHRRWCPQLQVSLPPVGPSEGVKLSGGVQRFGISGR